MKAANGGHVDVVQALLEAGAAFDQEANVSERLQSVIRKLFGLNQNIKIK